MKRYFKIFSFLLILILLTGCGTKKKEDNKPKDIMLGYSWQKKIGADNISKVFSITTSDILEIDKYDYVYDISAKKDNSVRAYLIKNKENSNYYDLIIAANNGIIANKNSDFLFRDFPNLAKVDLTHLYTDETVSLRGLFYNCPKLVSVNISTLKTNKVTNMMSMFRNCTSLQNIDLSKLDTSSVTDMSYMFYNMTLLNTLDLSNFDTSKVTNMSYMFGNNVRLTSLNVSSFNTSNVIDMSNMFYNNRYLSKLDLSSFDTSKVTGYIQMVHGCTNMKTLIISKTKWTIKITFSKDMKNTKLVYNV